MLLSTGKFFGPAAVVTPSNDPHYTSVIFLSHFTGSNGSTTFTDESQVPGTVVANGNAQIQSNKLELDGTGDWLSVADGGAWTLSLTDFTLECFGVVFDSTTIHQPMLTHWNSTGSQRGWLFDYEGTVGMLRFVVSSTGASGSVVTVQVAWSPVAGTPYDIACVNSSNDIHLYVNGTRLHSATIVSIFNSTAALGIGALNAGAICMDGKMSAVRMTSGVARYTGATYSVPSLPLPAF